VRSQPQGTPLKNLVHERIRDVLTVDVLIVNQIDAQLRAEAFVDGY
jgi:hypothetical protein